MADLPISITKTYDNIQLSLLGAVGGDNDNDPASVPQKLIGHVTGPLTDNIIHKATITDQGLKETLSGSDLFLISDSDDDGELKKATLSSITDLFLVDVDENYLIKKGSSGFEQSLIYDSGASVYIGATSGLGLLRVSGQGAKTTLTNALYVKEYSTSSSAVDKYGLIVDVSGSWTGGNVYGLAIGSVGTGATINYGLSVSVSGGTSNYSGAFTGGNFGIGTATPTGGTLHVVGTTKITSTVTLDSLAGTNNRIVQASSTGALSAGNLSGDVTTNGSLVTSIAALDATKIANGSISNTEFQFLNGVSSNVQDQLNSKGTSSVTVTGSNDYLTKISSGNLVQSIVFETSSKIVIGGTSGGAKLNVVGSVQAAATRTNTVFNGTPTTSNADFIGSNADWAMRTGTTGTFHLDVYNSGSQFNALSVTQAGLVQIGVTGTSRLTVAGSIQAAATRTNTVFNGTPTTSNADFIGSNAEWAIRTGTANDINFDTYNGGSNLNVLKLSPAGSVSIKAGSSSGVIAKVGGVIFDHFTDASTSGTSETDLYSNSIPANCLATNGDKIIAEYFLKSTGPAEAGTTFSVKTYFAGSLFLSGTAVSPGGGSPYVEFRVTMVIIRVNSTTVRVSYTFYTYIAGVGDVINYNFTQTGLSLSSANILKVTGQSSVGTDDIVAKMGFIKWEPAA